MGKTAVIERFPSEFASASGRYDLSGHIGPLYGQDDKPAWPMYSYDRPAYMLWNAIATVLHKRGWTDVQIKDWLQSKEPRWALDGNLGDLIIAAGKTYAETAGLEPIE